MKKIKIIGAGLAGSEAALQLADNGWKVELFEMRPQVQTPVHHTADFAELVCSNSLKSKLITTASGLLKEEMKILGCKLLPIAEECSVPAGNALAIDRELFGRKVTALIESYPNIKVHREEIKNLTDELTIVATGPLTSENLTKNLIEIIGNEQLYFFDAIAPIVSAESLDRNIIYEKTRYDKGEADYLNCPFSRDKYFQFVEALNEAEKHEAKEFESEFFSNVDFQFYENCTPIEELARRGQDTLRFGVMRPVGLEIPRTGERPYAVIQLRTENKDKTSYNLVGCQTMLKYGEQKKIFRMIPGLEKAEFLRYGSIHRNTYLNAPHILNKNLSLKNKTNIYIAGQLSGVEGYVESIFSGLLVSKIIQAESVKQTSGLLSIMDMKNVSSKTGVLQKLGIPKEGFGNEKKSSTKLVELLPKTTISGQLWRHLITENKNFQPMNANFGLLPPLKEKIKDKRLKKEKLAERAIGDFEGNMSNHINSL
ncbi:MAG: methylenetetrahydrofolate--tRNA-(uracil(54)-C(5))-methyltransferase (FADH(2)-oxidizing) TrmFO [Candidatus Cloacimonetes bacterium]|nr:methylenetetrahydrofolate--tRNA-(uracil(54)-C(5))-methyltransferase (FADH(2)-oxidizing) TrmFO [Candidatus Cloacimonadota bacterium]